VKGGHFIYILTLTDALMLKLYFTQNLSELQHVSVYLDHRQGVTEHQYSTYKNMDALLHTLKFVHKMFTFIIKLI
jgi:hypothetical protein